MAPPPASARRLRETLGRRPNPPSGGRWQLQRRHAEGGDWWTVEEASGRELLQDWVIGPPQWPNYGDLVRLLDAAGATRGFWVQGRRVLLDAGECPAWEGLRGYDWEAVWGSDRIEADSLLWAARGVDRRRLVLVVADCAETTLRCVPEGEERPREAIEVARRWVRGEASRPEARRALDAAEAAAEASDLLTASDARSAARAAAGAPNVASARYDADAVRYAVRAVTDAARAAATVDGRYRSETGVKAALLALAPLVRRWIPLPVVLLGRAGEPTPLSLGF